MSVINNKRHKNTVLTQSPSGLFAGNKRILNNNFDFELNSLFKRARFENQLFICILDRYSWLIQIDTYTQKKQK